MARETLDRKIQQLLDEILILDSMVEDATVEAVKALKKRYALERRIYQYPRYVCNPQGKKHELVNIKGLCKEYGIDDANFRKMLRGEYKHSKGWTIYRGEN